MITILKIFVVASGLFNELNYPCLDVPISWYGWLKLYFKWHGQQETKKKKWLGCPKTKKDKQTKNNKTGTNLKNQSEPMAH